MLMIFEMCFCLPRYHLHLGFQEWGVLSHHPLHPITQTLRLKIQQNSHRDHSGASACQESSQTKTRLYQCAYYIVVLFVVLSTVNVNSFILLSSPLVSWLGCTRWVPESCWPHPQMVTADWSTLAWVQLGSPIPYSFGAGWVPKAVQVGSQQDRQCNNTSAVLTQCVHFLKLTSGPHWLP